MELVVRVHTETALEDEAASQVDRIVDLLKNLGELQSSQTRRYWKNPDHYELLVVFEGVDPEGYATAESKLGSGWETLKDCEAVWNPAEDHTFILKTARWAHLELLEQ